MLCVQNILTTASSLVNLSSTMLCILYYNYLIYQKKKCLRVIYPLRKRHSEWNSGSFDTLTHTISIRIFDSAIQLFLTKVPPEQSDFFCIYIILSFKKYSYPILEKKKLDFPYYAIPWHTTITVSLAQKLV